jgi:adenylosuccinate lyase
MGNEQSPVRSRADEKTDLRALFSTSSRRQHYLDVEAALARAQGHLGLIPRESADRIVSVAALSLLDSALIDAAEVRTGHSMVALVEELARVAGEPHGGFVHWGATTQNIQQTGVVLILRTAHQEISRSTRDVLGALGALGERTADMAMAGRTHWQHAVPITFGFKVASWSDAFINHLARLNEIRPRLLRCMMGGAAGTFAAMGEHGRDVQTLVARDLGLHEMLVPARNIVDHFAELVCILGLIAATGGSMADEIARLTAPEFGEVSEHIPDGDVGSSTMPQKKNPKLCGEIAAAAARVRSFVPLALEAMIQSHEVDGARSAMMEEALENASSLTSQLLGDLHRLLNRLQVFPKRMAENLELSSGFINAEAVMMSLAPRIGRQAAHAAVHNAVLSAEQHRVSFVQALQDDPRVSMSLDRDELVRLIQPESYIGLSDVLANETSRRARNAVAEGGEVAGI